MSFYLFSICAIYGLAVLVPINSSVNFKESSLLSIDGIMNGSDYFIAHCVGVYLYSFLAYYFLYNEYYNYSVLRWNFLKKAKRTVTARSIIVEGLTNKLKNPIHLQRFYNDIYIGQVVSVWICQNAKKLTQLVKKRANSLKEVEYFYTKWLKNPCIKEGYHPSLFENFSAQNILNDELENENKEKINHPRPQVRIGLWNFLGPKIDAIDFFQTQFCHYDLLVKRERMQEFSDSNVGFVSFKNMRSAHIAAQLVSHSAPFKVRADLAPEPRDIYWKNISITARESTVRWILANICMLLVILFWGLPVSTVSSLLTINNLVRIFPFMSDLQKTSPIVWSFLTGSLPTLVPITFFAIIPFVSNLLSVAQGNKSYSSIEHSSISKHFLFLIINVLLVFTISGTLWQTLFQEILKNPISVASKLAAALPDVSPFFVNYVLFLGLAWFPVELLQIGPCIFYLFRNYLCKTPRDYAGVLAPVYADYSWLYGYPMLVFVITMTYSVVCPLILVVGALYFAMGYFTNKYSFMYVYFRSYETGGLMWPRVFRRIVTGLFLLQITMAGLFALKETISLSIAMIPLIFISVIFVIYVHIAFPKDCKYLPVNNLADDEFDECIVASPDILTEQPSVNEITPNIQRRSIQNPPSRPSIEVFDFPAVDRGTSLDEIREESPTQFPSRRLKRPSATAFSTINVEFVDDQEFLAIPEPKTDYRESPMSRFYGVLDSGMTGYGNPAIHGRLPKPWLPRKFKVEELEKIASRKVPSFNVSEQQLSIDAVLTDDS